VHGSSGNPTVQFESGYLPNYPTIPLDNNAFPVLSDRFYFSDVEVEMLQVKFNVSNANCTNAALPGAPARVIVGTTNEAGGIKYWIHTTSFELKDNDLDSPLPDGGKSAVTAGLASPNERMRMACSAAPRTFLNEDKCILSDDACYAQEGPDVDITLNVENLRKIWVCSIVLVVLLALNLRLSLVSIVVCVVECDRRSPRYKHTIRLHHKRTSH
jgi:hypothetical protein